MELVQAALLAVTAAVAVQQSGVPAPLPISMPIEPSNCALTIGAIGNPKLGRTAVIKYYENHNVVISWPLPEDQGNRDTQDMIVQLDDGWYAQSSGHISLTSAPDGDPEKLSSPIMSASFEESFVDAFVKASSLNFWDDKVAREQFALAEIAQPDIKKWAACIAETQERGALGGSVEGGYKRQKPLQRLMPGNNPATWITSGDYPSNYHPVEGTAPFSVDATFSGRVRKCTVTESSGNVDLDKATCKLVSRRARFIPATDKNGRPYRAEYKNRVTWAFPKDDPVMPVSTETN